MADRTSADSPELGVASWTGDAHPLASWVHRPASGRSHGAVVIVPPFGRERLTSYRALRQLAIELAHRGWVAVRFTWTGCGESAAMDPACAPAAVWHEDLAAAIELARATSGHPDVDAVGLRLGASMLAGVDADLRTRVLWEPTSGRAFLRLQTTLQRLTAPGFPAVDDLVEVPSDAFTMPQAAALRAIADPGRIAEQDRPVSWRIVVEPDARTAAAIYHVAPEDARVDPASLARVIEALPSAGTTVPVPDWTPVGQTVLTDLRGHEVCEIFVSVGPLALPGVLTTPLSGVRPGRPAVLLQPATNEPKGVTTFWPSIARDLAARGATVLRVDRRTSGDGEPAGVTSDALPTTETGMEDILTAARWLADRTGTEVTGVGLCLGAWTLARAAQLGAVSHLVGLNLRLWRGGLRRADRRLRELLADSVAQAALEELAEAPTARSEPAASSGRGGRRAGLIEGVRRRKDRLRGREPFWLHELAAHAGLAQSAARVLGPASRAARIDLYHGVDDEDVFAIARGPEALARLRRRGRRVTVTVETEFDHALLTEISRRRAAVIVTDALGLSSASGAPAETPSQLITSGATAHG